MSMLLKKFQQLERNGTKCALNAVCLNKLLFQLIKSYILIKGLCKKMLEAMTMAVHEGNVYCKQCYGRKFG
jgi:hypothetical protein